MAERDDEDRAGWRIMSYLLAEITDQQVIDTRRFFTRLELRAPEGVNELAVELVDQERRRRPSMDGLEVCQECSGTGGVDECPVCCGHRQHEASEAKGHHERAGEVPR